MEEALKQLKESLEGELFYDSLAKTVYATDASVYREFPLAVSRPKTVEDVKKLIAFAKKHKTSIIPRAAGTSLAGQVVGAGIVVDISKFWTNIIEVNKEEKWVRVQPGVNLDELNKYLEQYNLFFGPETSTSTRCMIGGMVGNNSCGSHSIIYGNTRRHTLELKCILSDGNEAVFKDVSPEEFEEKCTGDKLENILYRHVKKVLSNPEVQNEIRNEFPKPSIGRRNTGYALDEIMETEIFADRPDKFNFCKLLAGSEGTLAFITEIKLNLIDLPPKTKGAVAVHLNSIDEACRATVVALKYHPGAVELLDDIVLTSAAKNIDQKKNMFFIQGEPKAVIVVEWARETIEEINTQADKMEAELSACGLGYHFPRLYGSEINAAWTLRKAGLGLLANVPGDPKAVACIEDTAVDIHDQADYVREFAEIMKKYGKDSVYYAHIGDGELHLRPILDLKKEEDRELFYKITDDVATLVKKYRGSLSGEHGDGRVRGEFVRKMVGEKNYQLFRELKYTWDPDNIFNPGKIVDTPKMNEDLRYKSNQETRQFDTVFKFNDTGGILRMAEKCNGSGDCRKSHIIGGTMCPSYMATKNEKDTTRARANTLREFLTNSPKTNAFDHHEIKEVMDLCISCKGCKNECPSNVDMATLKAEFLQHYYDANGTPFRTLMIGNFVKNNELASKVPGAYNFLMTNKLTASVAKWIMGISQKRDFPLLQETTLKKWYKEWKSEVRGQKSDIRSEKLEVRSETGAVDKDNSSHLSPLTSHLKKVYLFCDEFTNFNDTHIGIKTVELLTRLGYEVEIPEHEESGRTFLSKGMVRAAQKLAIKNVTALKDIISDETPLIGIEPSCILSFRDEYPRLVPEAMEEDAKKLAKNCFLIDEFLAKELDRGNIKKEQFTREQKKIKLHGHCHQKALAAVTPTKKILELPENFKVEVIPSGCCGMAGSFGYEAEHFDVSMQIGELVLFPAVRKATDYEIAAPGTSCRHQIHDGTGRTAKHPVEILVDALV